MRQHQDNRAPVGRHVRVRTGLRGIRERPGQNAAHTRRQAICSAEKTVDEYKKARGGEPGGPWAVLTRSPELMSRTLMLSDYLRFNSTLPPRLSGRHSHDRPGIGSELRWSSSSPPLAVKERIESEVANAVAEGRRPMQINEDGRRACTTDPGTALTIERSESDSTYAGRCRKLPSRPSWTR